MDLVVLDTETTGLEVSEGHRVIELGYVLLSNRKHTETRFHHYINLGRAIDAEAREVHGISEAFLEDKPAFSEIMGEFLTFVKGTELVIHNAPFDLGFLNRELELAGHSLRLEEVCEVTDSLALARQMHQDRGTAWMRYVGGTKWITADVNFMERCSMRRSLRTFIGNDGGADSSSARGRSANE